MLKVPDDVTVDVVNLDGDRVKRLVEARAVRAYSPLRLNWDGTIDAGRRVRDGQYRLRVTLRDEGRSAVIQKTMNVDTRAPVSEVCVGFRCNDPQQREGNIISQGDRAVKIYIKGVSPRYATNFRLFRTDQGKPREVGPLGSIPGGSHRLVWEGLVNGKPLDPRDLPRPVRGPRHRGQRRDHAGRVRGRHRPRPSGHHRPRAGRTAAAAADHRGPAGRVPGRFARRAVPLARAPAGGFRGPQARP